MAEMRNKRGMSQQNVADILGTTRTAVHYWESGKCTIYGTHIINYCMAINADPVDLINYIKTLK